MSTSPAVAPPDMEKTRPKPKRDALAEVSPLSQPVQDMEETQPRKELDTEKWKRIKLSPRGLEILDALSGKRLTIADIKFAEEGPRDGGTFADVVAATLVITGRTVAVKKLRLISSMDEEKFLSGFVNEARLVDKLSHPNIVELTGFVEDMENRIGWLVFPWEENGNLRQFLRSGTWELPERVALTHDVACGLEYLHTQSPPICHGDLKSLNILVNSFNRAVIADFGSARTIQLAATSAPLPVAAATHTPSEGNETAEVKLAVVNNTLTLTGPACSAITDRYPFEEVNSEVHIHLKVIEGKLPMIRDDAQLSQIRLLCSIMEKCWTPNPRARPSAIECQKAIRWIPMAIPSTKSGDQSTIQSASLLMGFGKIHLSQVRHEEALTMFEQGVAIARSDGDVATLANLLFDKGTTLLRGPKYTEAEVAFVEALTIYESLGYDLGRAETLRALAYTWEAQHKYKEAKASKAEALAIFERLGEDLGRADTWKGPGEDYQKQCKYTGAAADKGVEITKSVGEDQSRANALLELGDAYEEQSKYIEAEASYVKAMDIYQSMGDDQGRANVLIVLGRAYQAQSKYIEAEDFCVKAVAIHTSTGNDLGRAAALEVLGEVHRDQSKYVEAEASYVEALAIHTSIREDLGRASALERLGGVHQDQLKYVEAEANYVEALAIYKSIGDNMGQVDVLQELGDFYQMLSEYSNAEASYAEARTISTRIRNDEGRVDSSVGLAQIRLLQARYAEAKALVEEVTSISERIDYEWGMDNLTELLECIRQAEGSSTNLLPSTLPDSTNAENSTTSGSLPALDQSSAELD